MINQILCKQQSSLLTIKKFKKYKKYMTARINSINNLQYIIIYNHIKQYRSSNIYLSYFLGDLKKNGLY